MNGTFPAPRSAGQADTNVNQGFQSEPEKANRILGESFSPSYPTVLQPLHFSQPNPYHRDLNRAKVIYFVSGLCRKKGI